MIRSPYALVTVVVVSAFALTTIGEAQRPDSPGADFVPNEVIVQFAAGASPSAKAAARARVGGATADIVRAARDGSGDLEVLRLAPGLSVAAAVRGLQGDAAVTFAEPNWIYTHGATS